MTRAANYIGVDIAKGRIDVFAPETARAAHILSTPRRLASFARGLPKIRGDVKDSCYNPSGHLYDFQTVERKGR